MLLKLPLFCSSSTGTVCGVCSMAETAGIASVVKASIISVEDVSRKEVARRKTQKRVVEHLLAWFAWLLLRTSSLPRAHSYIPHLHFRSFRSSRGLGRQRLDCRGQTKERGDGWEAKVDDRCACWEVVCLRCTDLGGSGPPSVEDEDSTRHGRSKLVDLTITAGTVESECMIYSEEVDRRG